MISNYHSHDDIIFGAVRPIFKNLFQYSLSVLITGKNNKNNILIPSVSSMLISKNSWEKVGRFKESHDGKYIVEDLIFINEIKKSNFKIHYNENAIVNWILPNSSKKVFYRFLEYSSGGIHSGFYNTWHFGILRNIIIFITLLILSYFKYQFFFILFILILFRSYLYLKSKFIFKKMNFVKKIFTTIIQSYMLILVDIASIFGFIRWLIKYKKFF